MNGTSGLMLLLAIGGATLFLLFLMYAIQIGNGVRKVLRFQECKSELGTRLESRMVEIESGIIDNTPLSAKQRQRLSLVTIHLWNGYRIRSKGAKGSLDDQVRSLARGFRETYGTDSAPTILADIDRLAQQLGEVVVQYEREVGGIDF